MVSERSLAVLRAIVQDYIESREPVGSKTIVERHALGVSAATIRNDMAQLEEEELIAAPHTSSGRIPTDKGYRLFVDQLTELRPLSTAQRVAIDTFLSQSEGFEDLLARTVRLLAQLTRQLAVVQYPAYPSARVRHVELVTLAPTRVLCVLICDTGQVEEAIADVSDPIDPDTIATLRQQLNEVAVNRELGTAAEALTVLPALPSYAPIVTTVAATVAALARLQRTDRLIVAGAANLIRTEQDFPGSLLGVIEAIEEQVVVLRLFAELAADSTGVAVRIGRENAPYGLADASVVSSAFAIPGRDVSRLGVVGPTRMDYPTNMAAVRAVARYLSRTLGGA